MAYRHSTYTSHTCNKAYVKGDGGCVCARTLWIIHEEEINTEPIRHTHTLMNACLLSKHTEGMCNQPWRAHRPLHTHTHTLFLAEPSSRAGAVWEAAAAAAGLMGVVESWCWRDAAWSQTRGTETSGEGGQDEHAALCGKTGVVLWSRLEVESDKKSVRNRERTEMSLGKMVTVAGVSLSADHRDL